MTERYITTISKAQIDALSIVDAYWLADGLTDIINQATTNDVLTDLIFPVQQMAEESIMQRSCDTLAVMCCKVAIALHNECQGDTILLALVGDAVEILNHPRREAS